MTLKAAFEAWVRDEYAPDGNVSWVDGPGLPDPPVIAQDGLCSSLVEEWTAYQAAHAAAHSEWVAALGLSPDNPLLRDAVPEFIAATAMMRTRDSAIEAAAGVAENVVGGFSANVRVSEDEQELVRDKDGPWVLNSHVAKQIRALAEKGGG